VRFWVRVIGRTRCQGMHVIRQPLELSCRVSRCICIQAPLWWGRDFIFNVPGVLLADVRHLVSSKEVGEWAHVSKLFCHNFKKLSGLYYSPKFTNYISLAISSVSNQGVLSP
jgi:hypothetical protein